ncbi:hypothetical protein BJP40_31045 [Streptomyces sp. CC53]|uniref:hypothetical protein n=1 Tax=Streptomyces sp. C8S0 TaxID=2585716 RepID=UPI0008DC8078|nr:hypothetical protein BJP40_31045 [Streptomyces sp. CC53]
MVPAAALGLVVEDGPRDELAVGEPRALPRQVSGGLQLPQPGGDPLLALREAGGEEPDADPGAVRQGLDVQGESDGEEAEPPVLGEVVAHHGEVVRVPGVDVKDA